MSLKYSSTIADYLQWSEAMNLIRKLARDSNYKMSLLIALGCFTGLRISDNSGKLLLVPYTKDFGIITRF